MIKSTLPLFGIVSIYPYGLTPVILRFVMSNATAEIQYRCRVNRCKRDIKWIWSCLNAIPVIKRMDAWNWWLDNCHFNQRINILQTGLLDVCSSILSINLDFRSHLEVAYRSLPLLLFFKVVPARLNWHYCSQVLAMCICLPYYSIIICFGVPMQIRFSLPGDNSVLL